MQVICDYNSRVNFITTIYDVLHCLCSNYDDDLVHIECLQVAQCTCTTVQSHDYTPPLCMLALGKSGEGAYMRDHYISVLQPLPTVTNRRMPRGCAIFSGCLVGKTR